MNPRLCAIALLLVACGKEEPQSENKPKAVEPPVAAVAPKPPQPPEKNLPPVPQGELQRMDPEKARFIAIPSTPKDPEVKKDESMAGKSVTEVKRVEVPAPKAEVEKPAPEVKKAEAPPAEQPVPEVKKAAPAGVPQQ